MAYLRVGNVVLNLKRSVFWLSDNDPNITFSSCDLNYHPVHNLPTKELAQKCFENIMMILPNANGVFTVDAQGEIDKFHT